MNETVKWILDITINNPYNELCKEYFVIYIVVFSISALFAYLADRYKDNVDGIHIICRRLLLLMTGIGPVLLGGFRNIALGTDNMVYASRFVRASRFESFYEALFMGSSTGGYDSGFNALMYLVSRFTTNYNGFCFVVSILTIYCVEMAFWKMRKQASFPISFLSFLFLYYCSTLNMIRQGLALAICLLSLSYFSYGCLRKSFLLILIACSIHDTAFVFFSIYILAKYLKPYKFHFQILLLIFVCFAVCVFWKQMIILAVDASVLRMKFLSYTEIDGFKLSFLQLLSPIPVLAILSMYRHFIARCFKQYNYIFSLVLIGYIFGQLAGLHGPLGRIGLYFSYPCTILIGLVVRSLTGYNKLLLSILIGIYLFSYWTIFTVFNCYGYERPVFPYYSCFE